MHKPSEALLQFIWQHRLIKPLPLVTYSGNELTVLHPGELNTNAGPDFANARIRLNGLVLSGNIEVHVTTSDWLKHKHQHNNSYDHLILHVVYEHDGNLPQNDEHHVEVLELKQLIDEHTLTAYGQLCRQSTQLACHQQLAGVNALKFTAWLERMAIERLETKVGRIEQLFEQCGHDYTQTFYTLLFRNFGFHVNNEPFELAAKHLPVMLLLKHADNLLQLEALLLGICGLLDNTFEDDHMHRLQREFNYLKTKYGLTPLQKELFKFSRLRPANFPTLRLAQLAALIHSAPDLLQQPQNYSTPQALKKILSFEMQGYWASHYLPDGQVLSKPLSFGAASAESLIINTFAPFFFFYSKKLLKPEYGDRALELLAACRFEDNTKTRSFSEKKSQLTDAAISQGLINLYDNYCRKKRCLNCGLAAAMLKPVAVSS